MNSWALLNRVSFQPHKRSIVRSQPLAVRLGSGSVRIRTRAQIKGIAMRVLVVEDEADLRQLIAQALHENGYAVDDAPDGHEGLFQATP